MRKGHALFGGGQNPVSHSRCRPHGVWCRMCLAGKGDGPRLSFSVLSSYHLRAAKAVFQTTDFILQDAFHGFLIKGSRTVQRERYDDRREPDLFAPEAERLFPNRSGEEILHLTITAAARTKSLFRSVDRPLRWKVLTAGRTVSWNRSAFSARTAYRVPGGKTVC